MLVLSRHVNESLIYGYRDDQGKLIQVAKTVIVDIRGDKVRVGVEACTNILIHRQEVREAILREDARARR